LDNDRINIEQNDDRKMEALKRDLGPAVLAALKDPSIIDIMLNPDGRIWYEAFGKGRYDSGETMRPSQAIQLFRRIAGMHEITVTPDNPILEAELPLDGSRFAGIISPIVTAPAFTIRKPPPEVFTLESYQSNNILTFKDDPLNTKAHQGKDFYQQCQGKSHYEVLCIAIEQRKNIAVIGGTGSGKTNLTNALIDYSARHSNARYVLMEDTREIKCNAENSVIMRTSQYVDLMRLLRVTLRFSPDRIIVGEVRGAEILALFTAWLTGHEGGVTTLHANNIPDAFVRMESMMRQGGVPPDPFMIASAVNVIVDIDREPRNTTGRKVRGIAVVQGYDSINKQYLYQYL